MAYVLVPGRHHLLSNFQLEYLQNVINVTPATIEDLEGRALKLDTQIDTVIWAVTGANHKNTRRNPIPGNRREVAIERFADQTDATHFVYMIDDLGHTPRFAEYVIKKIEAESLGRHKLTPENTVIAVSTPSVIKMYTDLGFQILPLELETLNPEKYLAERTWELVEKIVEANKNGIDWRTDKSFLTKVAKPSQDLFLKYNYGDLIIELFNDPVLGDDGDLTETRDYTEYVRALDEGAKRKYSYFKEYVRPGRVVDIGCATGSILREMSYDKDLRESDLFGIEVSRKLHTLCEQRKENGEFGNDHVFFYQRNIMNARIFSDNSVDTFTTLSLTHELESYTGRESLLKFLDEIYAQLQHGGVFINYDVIGPDDKDKEILMKLSDSDGSNEDWAREFDTKQSTELADFLGGLSTKAIFKRFAQDFRRAEGDTIDYETVELAGEAYVRLKYYAAAEFISKKDYVDNWYSEMHEKFCFWNFEDWKNALENVGFALSSDSKLITNPWIIENRLENKVEFFEELGGKVARLDYPPTNALLIAEKM